MQRRRVAAGLGRGLLYSLTAAVSLFLFLRHPGMNGYWRCRLGDLVNGTAWRPYVTRVLAPWTIRALALAAPAPLREPARDFVRRWWPDTRADSPVRDFPFESGAAAAVLFGCVLGFAFALRSLSRATLEVKPIWHDLIPAFALFVLPGTYMYFSPPYDFPTLLLFTLGLLFIYRRRTAAYLVAFILATLNKETSLLLALVWGIWTRSEIRTGRFWLIAAAQAAIWLVVRGGLALLYRDNPGVALEWHLPRNLQLLSEPHTYFSFRTAAGFIPRGLNVVYLAVLAWILIRLKRVPRFIRLGLLLLVPLVLAALFFGFVEELRDYYEVYPALILAFAASVLPERRETGGVPARPSALDRHCPGEDSLLQLSPVSRPGHLPDSGCVR